MASRVKLGTRSGENKLPQSAEIASNSRGKNGVRDVRPSGGVVNGQERIMVVPIRFLRSRGGTEFLAERFNVRTESTYSVLLYYFDQLFMGCDM